MGLAGFRWILPGRLAGSAAPGLLSSLSADLAFLREQGIARIVTLTERPLELGEAPALAAQFELLHFPIDDMSIPTPRACEGLIRVLAPRLESQPVLLHCRGGLGRTGTIAACVLVDLGEEPEAALTAVRRVNPNYVQSPAQAMFITHYARWRR